MNKLTDLKILVAEDNKINQRLAEFTFRQLGLTFDIASDGKEAFEMYRLNAYDLILMDMEMPILGGIESTRLIRAFESERINDHKVFIVAVTASETSEKKAECIDCGMDEFMEKPIRKEMLLHLIAQVKGQLP